MLPEVQLKSLANKLGLTKEETIFFVKRLEGWIESNGHTSGSLTKGINTILTSIYSNRNKSHVKINLDGIKHPLLKKYASEIIKLHNQGWGVRRIERWLLEAHRAKISYSSIYRLIKAQNG